jgi:hypothetical protein
MPRHAVAPQEEAFTVREIVRAQRSLALGGAVVLGALGAGLGIGVAATAPPASIGANPPGTGFHAVASGLAKVATEPGP